MQELDELELCNGHDFIHIFNISLMKAVSNRASNKILEEELERNFLSAYRFADFQQTNLYQSLQRWEEKRG